jgi:soluble lytic murein transglycosylase-like protein
MDKSSMSAGSIVGLCILVLVLYFGMQAIGNNSKLQTGVHYLQTGQTSFNYRQLARQDAQDAGINPDVFEKQINQESGFNPNVVSPAGAVGIAQFMPNTAQSLGINPYDPVQSLSGAASLMDRYYTRYQSYDKALAAYNAGTDSLNRALLNCGSGWRACVPAETQRYITAIMGY